AGARVAIWDMAEAPGQALADDLGRADARALFLRVNVVDRQAVEAATAATVAALGPISILINNAGITRDAQLVKVKDGAVVGGMSEADFDAVLAVNLKGVYQCTQAVVPGMIAQGYGRIISAASVVGLYGNFGQTNYAASKAGVIAMTRVWARELGKRGITANVVAPGFIATEMTAAMPPAVLADMVAHTPAGRMGSPADVAHAYLILAAEEASFINGAVLSVDGGLVLGT
ncbi:MAG TPA: SDR family oxidoreductase, partial [Chloroflexia bacterium]|nr:SDR family oxidoreductase [Chloroflexia bacterium]